MKVETRGGGRESMHRGCSYILIIRRAYTHTREKRQERKFLSLSFEPAHASLKLYIHYNTYLLCVFLSSVYLLLDFLFIYPKCKYKAAMRVLRESPFLQPSPPPHQTAQFWAPLQMKFSAMPQSEKRALDIKRDPFWLANLSHPEQHFTNSSPPHLFIPHHLFHTRAICLKLHARRTFEVYTHIIFILHESQYFLQSSSNFHFYLPLTKSFFSNFIYHKVNF